MIWTVCVAKPLPSKNVLRASSEEDIVMEGSVALQEKLLADPEILRAFFGEEEEAPGKGH